MKKTTYFLSTVFILICFCNSVYAQGYCPPTISCTSAAITSVTLNGTTNTSGTVGGYTNYPSPTFSVTAAQSYTISTTVNIGFAGDYQLNAWIDYDISGDWNGVISELITIAPVQTYVLGAVTKSTTFSVPATASIGNSKLRLQLRFVVGGGAQNPCQTGFCGEVEDYPLTIAALPPLCNSASNNSSNIYISRTDINGTTTFSGPSTYSSFSPNPSLTLFPQTTYFAIADITNPTNTPQNVYVYGWIDLNGNHVFSTSGSEQIVLTASPVTVPALGSITVVKAFNFGAPFSAQATTMRLNVSLAANGVPSPCETAFTGEVEDYLVLLHTDYCANQADPTTIGTSSIIFNGTTYPVACCNTYSDNTSTVINVQPGQSYPFSQVTYGGPTVAAVYVDFNQNGIFTDPGEAVTLTGPGTFSGTISVPVNAQVGNTRMRVVSRFTVGGGTAADCGLNGVFGTVADFTVSTISLSPPTISCSGNVSVPQNPGVCSAVVTYSTPICIANCNGGTISLISGLPSGATFPIGTTPVHYQLTTIGGTDDCFFNVTVNLSPLPLITPPSSSICQGTAISINSFSAYQWSTGATTQSIVPSLSGTYTVTVTNATGCTSSTSKTVTVNPLPAPTITGAASFCAGSSILLDAGVGFTAYSWSTGATSQTINVNSAATYTVTVTNGNGCTGSNSKTITVNANPTPSIAGITSFCTGSSTTLNAGPGFTSYNWSSGSTNQTISVNAAGTFTVTVTNANGCTGSDSKTITVNPNPTPSISGTLSFCVGGSTILDAGAGYSGYSWSTGATTQTINENTATTVTVTVTDGNGCTGSDSKTTTVNPNPTPAISGTLSFCAGSSTTLDAGAGYSAYSWSTGATSQTIAVNSAATFTVTVTNGNGCTGSDSKTTTVNQNPSPVISGNLTFCSGSFTTLDAGAGYSGYSWSTGATSQTISVNIAGTFTVTVLDGNGCTGSNTVNTTVGSCCNISLTATTTDASCHGQNNGSINVTSSNEFGSPSYTWSDGNTNEDRSGLTSGSYTVTVNYGNGCTASQSFAIAQPALLAINATASNISCRSTNTGSILLNPSGQTPPYSYLWNNGTTTQNRTSLAPGVYTVTVNDANQCGAVMQTFTITQPATQLIINTNKTNVRCAGMLSGVIIASPAGGNGPYSYLWNTFPVKTTSTVTGLAAGVYSCTVTDGNGCNKTVAISITEPPAINVVSSQTNVSFPGGNNGSASVSVSGGIPSYSYSWNTVPVKTTATVTGLTAGTYKCTISDSKSCAVKVTFVITQPIAKNALTEAVSGIKMQVLPNPSSGIFVLTMTGISSGQTVHVSLADIAGRRVYTKNLSCNVGEEMWFDFTSLDKGVYYLECTISGTHYFEKIIIQ